MLAPGEDDMQTDLQYTIMAEGLAFPEGPIACDDGTVLVVETAAGRVTRIHPDGRKQTFADTGGGPNGIAFGPDGAVYCCNNGGALWRNIDGVNLPAGPLPGTKGGYIQRIEPRTGKVEMLYEYCDGRHLAAPNDIVFDRDGGFWFTDFGRHDGGISHVGGLYYARADGSSLRRIAEGPDYNGVGLSPDGKTVYAALSFERWIMAFEANPHTSPPTPMMLGRVVADFPGRTFLDSLAIEADGTVAQACVFERPGIYRVNPGTGNYQRHDFGDMLSTNICFGGNDMCTAYVTLSHKGALAKAQWPAPGLKLAYNG
jgi:gluconolactonase